MLRAMILVVQMCTGQICEIEISADLISWQVVGQEYGYVCIVENTADAQCLRTGDPFWFRKD
jgi:hypothetical protein